MGSKKRSIMERIKEGGEVGKQAVAMGEKLEGDAREIRGLFDPIDRSMDEEDVGWIQNAEAGYHADFRNAFQDNVVSPKDAVSQIERGAADAAGEERDKVRDAADRMGAIASVTDVGRRNAEGAADRLRYSEHDYEEQISEATSIDEATASEVARFEEQIDSLLPG